MSEEKIEIDLPLCYESGDWDGKRSDYVIVYNQDNQPRVARMYAGFMDGSEFANWIGRNGYDVIDVVSWVKIPDLSDVGYYDLADESKELKQQRDMLFNACVAFIKDGLNAITLQGIQEAINKCKK